MPQVGGCWVKVIPYTKEEKFYKTTIFMNLLFDKPHDIVFILSSPCPAEPRLFVR